MGGPFWQVDAPYTCGSSSPCLTECLQELPVTTTTSCPGNTAVEVQCGKLNRHGLKFVKDITTFRFPVYSKPER